MWMNIINFVAGLACIGLGVNFFHMAYAPVASKSLPLYTNEFTGSLPEEFRYLKDNMPLDR